MKNIGNESTWVGLLRSFSFYDLHPQKVKTVLRSMRPLLILFFILLIVPYLWYYRNKTLTERFGYQVLLSLTLKSAICFSIFHLHAQ